MDTDNSNKVKKQSCWKALEKWLRADEDN